MCVLVVKCSFVGFEKRKVVYMNTYVAFLVPKQGTCQSTPPTDNSLSCRHTLTRFVEIYSIGKLPFIKSCVASTWLSLIIPSLGIPHKEVNNSKYQKSFVVVSGQSSSYERLLNSVN